MEASEPLVVIALPVAWEGSVIEGSLVRSCEDCAQDVWISPSTQKLLPQVPSEILCIPCAEIRQQKDPDKRVLGVTLEQAAEIEEHYRRN